MTTIVTSVEDAKKLEFGEQFVIEPQGFDSPDHDALEFEEEHSKLSAEVNEIVSQIAPPGDVRDTVQVEFTDTHAVISTVVDQTLKLGGDVRDTTVDLDAGKSTKRSLTAEGHGFVSVNGQQFPTP